MSSLNDIQNGSNISSEVYKLNPSFCTVTEINTGSIVVEMNGRPGKYNSVIVAGFSYPEKGDKGVVIFVSKNKVPVFLKLYKGKTNTSNKSQYSLGNDQANITMTPENITMQYYG